MGLRGPGAKAIKAVKVQEDRADLFQAPRPVAPALPYPWLAPGLSRLDRLIAFIESLPVTSGAHAGRQFKVREWQREFLAGIYTEGPRQVRTAVLSMARKNGKTDIAARLALAHLCGPEAEPRGEVYSAANDRFQASRLFAEMAAIIEQTPFLSDRVSIRRHSKEMEDIGPGGSGSTYAALSADVATKHGLSPSFVVYDELGQATSRDLFDALDTAMGARAEPLMLVISTQASTDNAPMSELIDYGLRVLSGDTDDPSFYLTFYTAPAHMDPWDEATWRLANPALGDFRSLLDVARMAQQARNLPSKEAAFRNLILNQRIAAEGALLSLPEWKACAGEPGANLRSGEAGIRRIAYAGLDLSQSRDLTALVLVFPDDERAFDVECRFWLPELGLADKAERDRVPYTVWRDQGHLSTTPGATIDPRWVAAEVARLSFEYDIQGLAFDRWRIEDFKRALIDEGITELNLIPFGQGFKDFGPAVDCLERHVASRTIRHGNQPVLTWCASNARAVADPAGNRKLDKSKSTGRIDGLVALAMALTIAERHAPEPEWTPMVEVV